MYTAQLIHDLEQLPPEAQHQIEDFIVSIKSRYRSAPKTKLSEEEFVGMWRDRPEMQDSIQWVKNSRQSETTQGDKTIDPSDLFGLWAENPKNLTDIRKQAWQRSESE
jgi:hypothetical protein